MGKMYGVNKMKTNLEDLKARIMIMKEYLEVEECSCGVDTWYANDLRTSIKRCQKQIKQLQFARDNPVVMVS